ncbi:MAG TPA: tetratricopeptide repeat protein [Pyrinomonadaceae bacterium]
MIKKTHTLKKLQIIALIMIVFSAINLTFAQNPQTDKELEQAMIFIKAGRHIDALPLLEKVAPRYGNDGELQAHYAVAILVNSVTIKNEDSRKKEVFRAGEILKKAKKLGMKNVLALHYLDLIEKGFDIDSVWEGSNKEVEALIREGEGFYGRAEYDKAFAAYERAYKLDPQSYEAALYAGDCFYAQKKYRESEVWFARAVAINQNREAAFRFWGDALANQGKTKEALQKFVEAFIAEPNSRLVGESFSSAIKEYGNRKSDPFIEIPAKKNETEIVIDSALLNENDGTTSWNRFTEIRKAQIEKFNKVANGRAFVSTVSEDVEALQGVALAAKESLRKNKSLTLSKSLENLIKLDSLGMLDVYTILFIHGGASSPEYEAFREKNRERMRKFLIEYFAEEKL